MKKLFLTSVLLTLVVQMFAYFESNGIYYNVLSSTNMTVEVTYGKQYGLYEGIVTIPDWVTNGDKTYYVVRIGKYAFRGCTNLSEVILTNCKHLTTISDHAFSGCNVMGYITIPATVTSIGNYAFSGCMNLHDVILEDGTTTLNLGFGASKGQNQALFADAPLRKFYWGRPLSYDTNYGLAPTANQANLTDVTIGPKVSTLTAYMFYNNKALTSINVPETVTALGNYAFYGFTGLKSFTIAENIKSIGSYAFAYCYGLTSITIPSHITAISTGTFKGCTGLTSFHIPNTLNSIGNYAFAGCTGIKTVTFEKGKKVDPQKLSLGYGSNDGPGYGLFNDCPIESIDLQRALTYNVEYDAKWNNSTKTYSYRSPFREHPTLKKVTIGDEITYVYNYLFYNAKYLKDVTLPQTATDIGKYAFYGCESLGSLLLPNSLETIGVYAFANCNNMTGLIFHPALTSIGNYAFSGCTSFNNFAFEEGEKPLALGNGTSKGEGYGLFTDCPLKSIFIGRNLTYKYKPFYGITTLTEARFGNPVTSIPNYILQNCTELTTVAFNKSCQITDVGKYAFDNCPKLALPALPQTYTSIGEAAFRGCAAFTQFTIPSGVTTIGSQAFAECSGLQSLTVLAKDTPKTPENAFTNYEIPLNVPRSSVSAYQQTMPWSKFSNIIPFASSTEHQLTYMVDGEVYKTYILEEGTAITPEAAPTKQGYVFMGWSSIPATMPAEDLVITGTFVKLGDVNADGRVTITDAVGIVNFILGNPVREFNMKAADVNGDDKITITDAVSVVNIILKSDGGASVRETEMSEEAD